jgi:hypothetical protein
MSSYFEPEQVFHAVEPRLVDQEKEEVKRLGG